MKTALITGGGSGIGLAIASTLAKENFRVGLIGRQAAKLAAAARTIAELGGECWWAGLDVTDLGAVTDFVSTAVGRYGRIDLLVNSAGTFEIRPFSETTPEFWGAVLAVNLTGVYNCSRAVWPHIAGGQIINISSVAGVQAFEGNAAYSASKYGVIGLSEVLALEGKARDIRVHILCPGPTDTDVWAAQAPPAARARMLRPEQVADLVRWLATSPPELTVGRVILTPMHDPWQTS